MPDKPMSVIPDWMVWHICHSEGRRQVGKKSNYTPVQSYHGRHFECGPAWAGKLSQPTPLPRLLGTSDYRFWSQVKTYSHLSAQTWNQKTLKWEQPTSSAAWEIKCRWCARKFSLDADALRKQHKRDCKFTHNLRQVYLSLLAAGSCVICDAKTSHEKWGVPLCSPNCEERWVGAEEPPLALRRAVYTTRNSGKISLHAMLGMPQP